MTGKIESVKAEVPVETSRERTFQVFVEGIDRWWPRSHHVGKSPLKKGFLEGQEGGRWCFGLRGRQRRRDRQGAALRAAGAVGARVAAQQGVQYGASFNTEAEVKFVAEGPQTTRVLLAHRDLERYGEAAETLRKSISSPGGWPLIPGNFAKDAAATEG